METLPATMNASRSLEGMLDGVAYPQDRKSTRLNSSHSQISYAVFCLKKKKHDVMVTVAREVGGPLRTFREGTRVLLIRKAGRLRRDTRSSSRCRRTISHPLVTTRSSA